MTKSRNPQSPSAGQILKKTRESKGIALETVHDATKIPLDALKAIEEGYTVRSLSPFYIKGFIKMYAQYLGVDVSEVREDYHAEELPKTIKKVDTAEAIENKVNRVFTRERQKLIVQIAAAVVVLFIVVRIGGCIKAHTKRSPKPPVQKAKISSKAKTSTKTADKSQAVKKETQPTSQAAAVKKAETPPAPAPGKAAPPASKADDSSTQQETKNVHLTIKTRKSGWLQVKVDGNVVFQSTINQGAVESWEAQKIIELSGKDIHNLEFEVNGRVLGTLGRADRNARRVVVTKDGLSVKE